MKNEIFHRFPKIEIWLFHWLQPRKNSNLCFFGVLRGYRKRPVAWNGLRKTNQIFQLKWNPNLGSIIDSPHINFRVPWNSKLAYFRKYFLYTTFIHYRVIAWYYSTSRVNSYDYAYKKFKQFCLYFTNNMFLRNVFAKRVCEAYQDKSQASAIWYDFSCMNKCKDFRQKFHLLQKPYFTERKGAAYVTWVSKSTVEFEYFWTSICHHQTCIQYAQKRPSLVS